MCGTIDPNDNSYQTPASENYSKLRTVRLGPYRIISVAPGFLKIDQDEITNTIIINRVTCNTPPHGPARTTEVQQGEDIQMKNKASLQPKDKKQAGGYVFDLIIRHVDTQRTAVRYPLV